MLYKYLTTLLITGALGACSQTKEMTEMTPRQAMDLAARCEQLKEQIKELKDKPVRRTTAIEYYEKECLRTDTVD